MPFADHYGVDVLRQSLSADTPEKRIPASKRSSAAFAGFLAEAAASGRMKRIAGLGGRRIPAADAWNALIDGTEADRPAQLVHRIARLAIEIPGEVRLSRAGDWQRPLDDGEVERAHALLCERMDAGDLHAMGNPVLRELEDSMTSDQVSIVVKGWQPTLMRLDEKTWEWVAAVDVDPQPLAAAPFDVPSGRLLLTDFLRVAGIETAIEDDEESVVSDAGQLATTLALAARHDMGYCQTDNTGVAAFRVPSTGAIAIFDAFDRVTQSDVAPEGLEPLGRFSCDMWRVTAVDAAVAQRLATKGGNGDEKAVERYLALAAAPDVWPSDRAWNEVRAAHHDQCYSRNVLAVDVAPGRWAIHCGSDFSARADRAALGVPAGGLLWCVIAPAS